MEGFGQVGSYLLVVGTILGFTVGVFLKQHEATV